MFLVPGQNHHAALVAFAFALRLDPAVRCQRHVHDATLTWRHGVESRRPAAASDTSCRSAGQSAEHVCSSLPVVLNVHNYERLASQLPADNHSHQELQRLQGLTAAANQETGVLALDLENERAVLGVISHICFGNYAHCCQEVIQNLGNQLLCLGVRL